MLFLVTKLQLGNVIVQEALASFKKMRDRYKTFDSIDEGENVYFVTITVVEWIPLFIHNDHFQILTTALTFCRKEKGLKLYAYVIMENHIHMIVSGPNLPEIMQSFKSFTAKELVRSLTTRRVEWMLNQFAFFKKKHKQESDFQIWQEGYHPKMIVGKEVLEQKIDYIHLNPVRRGYVAKPEHWQYSSASKIVLGEDGVLEIDEFVW